MRRLAGLLALVLLAGCGMFGGGHSNLAPPTPLKPLKPALKVTRVWSHQSGNGTGGYHLILRPALWRGTVYVASADGVVAAYRATSGKKVWRTHLARHVTGGVGAGHGLVVVGSRRGWVVALNARDGKPVWQAQAPSGVLAAPVVGPHGVYVATLDGHVTALGLAHGRRLWVVSHTEPALKLDLVARPTWARHVLYEGYADGDVVALRARDGRRLWTSPIVRPRGGDPVERLVDVGHPISAQGLVYADSYHGNVVALAARSGRILWSHPGSSYRNMALGGQSLYVVTAHSRVVALANASGARQWRQKALLNRRLGDPALAGPAVVVGDYAGYTQWLSRRTGRLLARKRVSEGAVRAAPLVASPSGHGTPEVFVLSTTGRLTALRFRPRSR